MSQRPPSAADLRSARLIEELRERILSSAQPDGIWIKQDQLAAELGVSKIPIREALVRLEQEGLVTQHANRGFFASPLSRDEAEEVFALRLMLEPDATALGAALAGPAEQEAAFEALAKLDAAVAAGSPAPGPFNRAFHMALIRPGRRPVTTTFLERLHILAERYVRKHLEPQGRGHRAHEEHSLLIRAWSERRQETVAALTRAHIAATLEDLRGQLPPRALA